MNLANEFYSRYCFLKNCFSIQSKIITLTFLKSNKMFYLFSKWIKFIKESSKQIEKKWSFKIDLFIVNLRFLFIKNNYNIFTFIFSIYFHWFIFVSFIILFLIKLSRIKYNCCWNKIDEKQIKNIIFLFSISSLLEFVFSSFEVFFKSKNTFIVIFLI